MLERLDTNSTKSVLNPYVVGSALSEPSGRGFYGRKDIFEFVRSGLAVEQRGPILLFGQRRIGKSSILRQLPNHLPSDWVCVYFDLQGKASMDLDGVLFGLARAIASRLDLLKPTREEATEDTFKSQFFARVVSALDGQPRRLVLLFDEFDVVDEKLLGEDVAARRFIGYLSDFTAEEPEVGCILVVGRRTEELSSGFNAALLKNSIQHKIGRLSQADCSALIEELANGYLTFDSESLEAIYNLTAGHPFCTQVLCNTIWSRYVVDSASFPVRITSAHVMGTLPLAIERGTTGLNWSFDGVVNPVQRLLLSAMAGEMDGGPLVEPVSMSAIERILRSRKVGVERSELARAPKELENWDIIVRSDQGYRFAVPMIGLWIKKERPLDQLMSEARFSNPQAYQYYELAVQAHQNRDLDRAILDYRGAVEANPVFLEAYRGLAEALIESKGASSLDEAIEINERILEINPEESRTPLLDLLSRRLDEPANVELHIKNYERIRELESADGYMLSRARRQLEKIGFALIDRYSFDQAEKVFLEVGDEKMVATARSRRRSSQQYFWLTLAYSLLCLIGVGYFSYLTPGGLYNRFYRAGILGTAVVGGVVAGMSLKTLRLRRRTILVGAGESSLNPPDRPMPDIVALSIGVAAAALYYFFRTDASWYEPIFFFLGTAYFSWIRQPGSNELEKVLRVPERVVASPNSQDRDSQRETDRTQS